MTLGLTKGWKSEGSNEGEWFKQMSSQVWEKCQSAPSLDIDS